MHKVGWGVAVQGPPLDVDDWCFDLEDAFEPYTVRLDEDVVLRSTCLDAALNPASALVQAEPLVSVLNGLFAVRYRSKPLKTTGLSVQFREDGSFQKFQSVSGVSESRSRARAKATAIGPGETEPQTPMSDVQKAVAVCDTNSLLADAMRYFGRCDNWFDAYKCFECLKALSSDKSSFETKFKLFKHTANTLFRHDNSALGWQPPSVPMPFEQAREDLREALEATLISQTA